MRLINEIIIHCSATKAGQDFDVNDIDRWHKERGWKGVGYHYVIKLDGTIQEGRPVDQIGAHCTGHNKKSIGICYIGGLDKSGKPKDTRTVAQKESSRLLVNQLLEMFPGSKVYGHSEFAPKCCPCFCVSKEF